MILHGMTRSVRDQNVFMARLAEQAQCQAGMHVHEIQCVKTSMF